MVANDDEILINIREAYDFYKMVAENDNIRCLFNESFLLVIY